MTTAAPVSTKAAHGLSICPPFYFKSQLLAVRAIIILQKGQIISRGRRPATIRLPQV